MGWNVTATDTSGQTIKVSIERPKPAESRG